MSTFFAFCVGTRLPILQSKSRQRHALARLPGKQEQLFRVFRSGGASLAAEQQLLWAACTRPFLKVRTLSRMTTIVLHFRIELVWSRAVYSLSMLVEHLEPDASPRLAIG